MKDGLQGVGGWPSEAAGKAIGCGGGDVDAASPPGGRESFLAAGMTRRNAGRASASASKILRRSMHGITWFSGDWRGRFRIGAAARVAGRQI